MVEGFIISKAQWPSSSIPLGVNKQWAKNEKNKCKKNKVHTITSKTKIKVFWNFILNSIVGPFWDRRSKTQYTPKVLKLTFENKKQPLWTLIGNYLKNNPTPKIAKFAFWQKSQYYTVWFLTKSEWPKVRSKRSINSWNIHIRQLQIGFCFVLTLHFRAVGHITDFALFRSKSPQKMAIQCPLEPYFHNLLA